MSEELHQKNLTKSGIKVGPYEFYNIGATSLSDLKRYKIIPDTDYGNYARRKPDALLVDRRNLDRIEVVACIEYKKSNKFVSDKDITSAIQQCNTVAQVLGAQIGIATDTQDFHWINPLQPDDDNNYTDSEGNQRSFTLIKDEQKQRLSRAFNVSETKGSYRLDELNDDTRETIELIDKVSRSINGTNSTIHADKTNDPTELAKQIWQDVWSVSGATPENCLYTFVELFIFKYLSDLGILQRNGQGDQVNFDYIYSLGQKYAFTNYTKNVRPYLKELFKPEKPVEQGGTTIINGTVLTGGVDGHDAVFYKILGRFNSFGELKNIDPNFKSNLFEKFLKESISKKNWGQFFTPRKVIKPIIDMAGLDDLPDGAKICDPFCGVGGFVLEPLLLPHRKADFYVENGKIQQKNYYYGYDKGFIKEEQKTIILAKANMLIFLSDLLSKHKSIAPDFADIFNETFHLRTKSILGTLDMMPGDADYKGPFDVILTNPPYVTSGSSNLKEAIKDKGLESFYKVNGMGVEALALEWVIRNLKPNGRAFVVIPDGILNRQNDAKLRQFITDECYLECIISLPVNTFFTTPKKTYILGITKKTTQTDKQVSPVFTYLVSNIGETLDVYRFDIEENDLEKAKLDFKMFRANKDYVPDDPRCKIVPISKFEEQVNSHWSVDRWWTVEEKVELGIEEETETQSIEDYLGYIKDYSDEFNKLAEESRVKLSLDKDLVEGEYLDISLTDEKYFNLFIGKRILKKDLFRIQNDVDASIPLYSANVNIPFGKVKESNIKSFAKPRILWGIDGNFDIRVIEAGEKYATTDHCGAIDIVDDRLDPHYVSYMLNTKKHEHGLDRSLRASLKNVKAMSVRVPVKNGEIDTEKQAELTKKLQMVSDIQDRMFELASKVKNLSSNAPEIYTTN